MADVCCESLDESCEKSCLGCFKHHLKEMKPSDGISVLSIVVDWEFIEAFDLVFSTFQINIFEEHENYTYSLSIFEKACMTGNSECVEKILKYQGVNIKESILNVGIFFAEPRISNMISEWKSMQDTLDLKCPDDDFYINPI